MTAVPFDVPCGDAASRRAARAAARAERRAARLMAREERSEMRRLAWERAGIIEAGIRDRRDAADRDGAWSWGGPTISRYF